MMLVLISSMKSDTTSHGPVWTRERSHSRKLSFRGTLRGSSTPRGRGGLLRAVNGQPPALQGGSRLTPRCARRKKNRCDLTSESDGPPARRLVRLTSGGRIPPESASELRMRARGKYRVGSVIPADGAGRRGVTHWTGDMSPACGHHLSTPARGWRVRQC